jgi:hypothetical protein
MPYSNITITTNRNLSFVTGSFVQLINDSDNYINGQVVSYNASTGALTITPTSYSSNKTGVVTGWTVVASARPGTDGSSGTSGTSPSITGLVPYTGATTNVDLGTNQLRGLVIGGEAFYFDYSTRAMAVGLGGMISMSENVMRPSFGHNVGANEHTITFPTTNRDYTMPDASGTLALTSNIPSVSGYVPYTGATANVDLGTKTLTAASFFESSDIRFKNVLETNPVIDLSGIDVIKFTRVEDDKYIRYGYSAQQVQEILPDVVSDGDKLTVNYTDIHTLKIAALERRIAELEAKLNQ